MLNTVIGSLAAYGLGGLNAKFTAVLLNVLLVALQSLVATQFQIACVLATPNQDLVRAALFPPQQLIYRGGLSNAWSFNRDAASALRKCCMSLGTISAVALTQQAKQIESLASELGY